MAKQEIIWDDAPQTKTQEISWDDQPSDIKWDKPKSVLDPLDLRTKVSNVIKGFGSGLIKFKTVGEVNKLIGDHYEEIANTQKESLDAVIKAQGDDNPLFQKRRDITKQMTVTNDLLKDPNLAPDAKIELDTQLQKLGGEVSNIDKVLTPKYSNYNDLIKNYDKVQGLFDKAKVKKAVGQNLIKQHEDILNKFTTAEDRDTFSYQLGSGIESMVEAVAVNVAVPGTAFAKSVATGVGLAMPGAIDMYDRAVGTGMEPAKARVLALGSLSVNAALEAASFEFIFKKGANALIKGFATEGTQELTQTFADNATVKTFIDKNQDLTQGLMTSFLVGGIIGGAVGGVQQRGYNRDVQEYKNQFKDKYKDVFVQNGLTEPDVNAYLDTVAQKAIDSQEVITEKMVNDDLLKMAKTLGKETETDVLKTQPIQGEIDLNDPGQIDIAIREKNKFISQNENNPAMRNEVAMAMQEREQLAEGLQEKINLQNVEAVPAEIGQIKADLKEETGVDISDAQAGAIMREMLKSQTQLVRESDKQQMSEGGKVVVTGGTQVQPERTVTGIPSQRRAELKGIKSPTNVQYQSVAEKNLVEGYMEQGGIKIPGSSEYTFLKAQTENNTELYKQSIVNAKEEIDSVIKSTEYKSLDEMKEYLKLKDSPIAQDPEVQNEFKNLESAVQVIESASNRIKAAEQKLGQPTQKTDVKESEIVWDDTDVTADQGSQKSFAKMMPKSKEPVKGGQGAKRLDYFLINELAKNLSFRIDAVDKLRGNAVGMAFPDFGIAKIKRELWKGEFGAVAKQDVGELEFKALQEAGVIDDKGVIDATRYNGKLGQLKDSAEIVFQKYGIDIEVVNKALVSKRNTELLSDVMAHEIGHLIDAMPNAEINRGNIIGRLLAGIKNNKAEDIQIIGSNSEIKKELVALTEWWSPYDRATAKKSYIAYRNSSPELYAEALSVYLNDPKVALERAPLFFENFEKNLYRKPGLKEGIEFLNKLRNADPKAIGEYALQSTEQSMEKAEDIMKLVNAEKKKDKTILEKVDAVKTSIFEEFAIGDLKIRQLMKNNGLINDLTDVTSIAGKDDYLNLSGRKLWIAKPKELVGRFVNLFGDKFEGYVKPNSDLGKYLIAQRIIHDRSGIANRLSPEAAKAMIDQMKNKEQLSKEADKYYQFMDGVMRNMVDYGIMSEEHYSNIKKNNQKYAFFHVAEKEIEKATSAYGDTIPAGVKNQTGTTKDIRNPVPATVDLLNKMGWMMEINRMKIRLVETLESFDKAEDVIRSVTPGKNGQKPKPDKGYKRIDTIKNSEYVSYDVREDIASEYESTIAQLEKIPGTLRILRPIFSAVKMGVTKYSPGFTIKNPIRDIQDAALMLRLGAIPGVSGKDVKAFIGNLREGYSVAYQAIKNPADINNLLAEAENNGTIIPRELKFALDEAEMNQILSQRTEEILNRSGNMMNNIKRKKIDWKSMTPKQILVEAVKLPFLKYGEFMTAVNEINENATKLAFYKTLKDKGFAPEDAAIYTRRMAGTPDPTYGGKARLAFGTIFGFFNPTVQGNMRLVHAFTKGHKNLKPADRAKLYGQMAGRVLTQPEIVLGTVLAWALKNLWDDDPEKNPMASVSDAALERYFVIPAFGKEIRIPRGQMNQILHKITWEFLDTTYSAIKGKPNESAKNMKQFVGSVFMMSGASWENLTPVLKVLTEAITNRDWKGKEIYDPNNSEFVKSQKIFKHIFKGTFGAPVPKDLTLGFVSDFTGDTERFEKRITKKYDLQFKTAKADMMTEMDNIYKGKNVNPERLKRLAANDPMLLTMAEKAIGLSMKRKDVMEQMKNRRVSAYAREISNIIKGTEGIQGTKELQTIIKEARNVLTPEQFQAVNEYIGLFSN